ncbi:MAG: hypothetical protein HY976_00560 [Candidatus Kerfeldbacteria bacterium]|nr:hypothetical protein [Candidatus Kerfeldbacteria bacterium]
MNERSPEFEPPAAPGMLDLVRLDGRWAQVMSGPETSIVTYLDDGASSDIRWSDYRLLQKLDTHVENLVRRTGLSLIPEEFSRIHTGPDQRTHADAANDVHVFGEYAKNPDAV